MPRSLQRDDDVAALRGRLSALTAFCSVLGRSLPALSRQTLLRHFDAVSRRLEANALASSMPEIELTEMMQLVGELRASLRTPANDASQVDLVAALTERRLAHLARGLPSVSASSRTMPRSADPAA